MIEPVALASITSAIAVLGNEYLKGVASETARATWSGVKALFGWTSDPEPAEIPEKVARAISESPAVVEKLVDLLKSNPSGAATALVGRIEVSGGKVIIANTINAKTVNL